MAICLHKEDPLYNKIIEKLGIKGKALLTVLSPLVSSVEELEKVIFQSDEEIKKFIQDKEKEEKEKPWSKEELLRNLLPSEENEILQHFLYYTLVNEDGIIDSEAIQKLDFQKVKNELEKLSKEVEPDSKSFKIIESLLTEDSFNYFKIKTLEKFATLSLKYDSETDATAKALGITLTPNEEIDPIERARDSVKLRLMLLPEVNPKKIKASVLGIGLNFLPVSETYSVVLNALSNINIYEHLNEDNTFPDLFDLMMDKLTEQSKIYPSLYVLVNYYINASEKEKTDFVYAFHTRTLNFLTVNRFEQEEVYGGQVVVFNKTNVLQSEQKLNDINLLTSLWERAFTDKRFSKDKKKLEETKSKLEKIRQVLVEKRQNKEFITLEEAIKILNTAFKTLGINLPENDLEKAFIISIGNRTKDQQSVLNSTGRIIGAIINTFDSFTTNPKNTDIRKTFSVSAVPAIFLKSLATLQAADFNRKILGPDGTPRYPHTSPDFLSKAIDKHNALSVLNRKITKRNLEISYFLRVTDNKYRDFDTGNIQERDELISKFLSVVNIEHYPYLTLADKKRQYFVKGATNVIYNKEQAVEVLRDLMIDEIKEIQKAYKDTFGKNKLPETDLILDYHYKLNDKGEKVFTDENGFPVGDAFKSMLFPQLNPGSLWAEKVDLHYKDYMPGYPRLVHKNNSEIITKELKILANYIYDQLVKDELEKLVEKGVLSKNGNNFNINHLSLSDLGVLINKDNPNKLTSLSMNTSQAKNSYGAVWIGMMLNHIIQTKLFYGRPNFYGSFESFAKRTPAVSAPGQFLRIYKSKWGAVKSKFNLALINNIIKPSETILSEENKKNLKEIGLNDEEIEALLSPYEKVNRTDAQGWITPERFKEIALGLYGWNDELEEAFTSAKEGKANKEQIMLLLNHLPLSSLKGQHTELLEVNDNRIPVYIKYSQFPLFPQFVKDAKLQSVLSLMRKSNTDELVVLDGSKAASFRINDLDNVLNKKEKLLNISLDNSLWKLQQESVYHEEDKNTVGVQVERNLITDLDDNEEFIVGKEKLTGKQIKQELKQLKETLSDINIEKIKEEFGFIENQISNGVYTLNKDVLIEKIIKLIEKRVSEEDLTLIYTFKDFDILGGISNLVQNSIFSLINKNAIKFKEEGNSAVQVSPEGFTDPPTQTYADLEENIQKGIIWLTDKKNLEPPKLIKDNSGKLKVTYGQVLLPYSVLEKHPEWDKIKNLPTEEIITYFDEEILNIIGYRIPNQKLSFTQPLKVVGILPKEAGNSIVAYSEIVVQTGADYDIDKMFLIYPSVYYSKKENKLKKEPFLTDENSSIKQRYNRKFNREWSKRKAIKDIISTLEENDEEILKLKNNLIEELSNLRATNALIEEQIKSFEDELDDSIESQNLPVLIELTGKLKNLIASKERLKYVIKLTESDQSNKIKEELFRKAKKRAIENNLIPSLEEFSTLPIIKQNIKESIQNRKLDVYQSILTAPNKYKDLVSTVDTSFLKEFIDTIYPSKENTGLSFFSTINQTTLKKEMLEAKQGVSMIAVSSANHSYAQLYHPFIGSYKYGNIYTEFDELIPEIDPVSKKIIFKTGSRKRIKISDAMSAFMNAFVDAAKDNYIMRANMNSYLAPIVYHLIKGNIPFTHALLFIGNPIIKKYVELQNEHDHVFSKGKPFESLKELSQKLRYTENALDITNLEELTDLYNDKNTDIDKISGIQAKALKLLVNLVNEAKEARKQESHDRLDVDGARKNIYELLSYLINEPSITQRKEKEAATALGTLRKNSVELAYKLGKEFSLILSNIGKNILLLSDINIKSIKNPEIIKNLEDEIKKAIHISFLKRYNGITDDEIISLFTGSKNVVNRIINYIESNSDKSNYPGKLLFSKLKLPDASERVKTIRFNRLLSLDEEEARLMTDDWKSLYFSNDPQLEQLAIDLAIISILADGVKVTNNSIGRFIPVAILSKLGFLSNEFKSYYNYWKNPDEFMITRMFNQIVRTSSNLTWLIPEVSMSLFDKVQGTKKRYKLKENAVTGNIVRTRTGKLLVKNSSGIYEEISKMGKVINGRIMINEYNLEDDFPETKVAGNKSPDSSPVFTPDVSNIQFSPLFRLFTEMEEVVTNLENYNTNIPESIHGVDESSFYNISGILNKLNLSSSVIIPYSKEELQEFKFLLESILNNPVRQERLTDEELSLVNRVYNIIALKEQEEYIDTERVKEITQPSVKDKEIPEPTQLSFDFEDDKTNLLESKEEQKFTTQIEFEEESTSGYRNRTIKQTVPTIQDIEKYSNGKTESPNVTVVSNIWKNAKNPKVITAYRTKKSDLLGEFEKYNNIGNPFPASKTNALEKFLNWIFDENTTTEPEYKLKLDDVLSQVRTKSQQDEIKKGNLEKLKKAFILALSEKKYKEIKNRNTAINKKLSVISNRINKATESKVGDIIKIYNDENLSEYKAIIKEIKKFNDYSILKIKTKDDKIYTIKVDNNNETKTGKVEGFVKNSSGENINTLKKEYKDLKSQLETLPEDPSEYFEEIEDELKDYNIKIENDNVIAFKNKNIIEPEYRKALIEALKSGRLKGMPIEYYKDLGRPSHATVIDYLINKYDWNSNFETEGLNLKLENSDKTTDVYSSQSENDDNLQKILEDSEKVILVPNENYYELNGLKLLRQSNYVNPNVQSNEAMQKGAVIGNIVDEIGRKVFAGETLEYDKFLSELKEGSISRQAFDKLVSEFTKRRKVLLNKGYKIYSQGVFVYKKFNDKGRIRNKGFDGIGGTVDLLLESPTGGFYIVDFKNTKSTSADKYRESNIKKWSTQQTVYKYLAEEMGLPVKSISIFEINTEYDNSVDIDNIELDNVKVSENLIKLEEDKVMKYKLIEDLQTEEYKNESNEYNSLSDEIKKTISLEEWNKLPNDAKNTLKWQDKNCKN